MGRVRHAAVVAGIALMSSVSHATGGGVAMLLSGERVRSTLSTSGDRKVVAFAGVEGSSLTLTAKALPGSDVIPTLSLSAPDGAPVGLGETNPKAGRVAKARSIQLGATGVWRVAVETSKGHGGAFELVATAKAPSSSKWTASLDGVAPADHEVAAAPGGSITVSVAAKAREIPSPVVELLSPSGAQLAKVTGTKGKVALPPTRLDELGRYRVRVSGGAGAVSVRATVRPGAKRELEFKDVESRPEIRSFTPGTTVNQSLVPFEFDGVGFAAGQSVSLAAGAQSAAIAAIVGAGPTTAVAEIDLAGVEPGTYALRVGTPAGNVTEAASPLVVTNRPPSVAVVTPTDVWNTGTPSFQIHGAGFDATAGATIRHAASGLVMDLTPGQRLAHELLGGTVAPPPFLTGPADVTVKDPDDSSGDLAGGIDFVGPSRAGATLTTFFVQQGLTFFGAQDVAVDTKRDRALVVHITPQKTCTLLVVDLATLAVLDTIAGTTPAEGGRAAYDAVSDTYAVCLGKTSSPGTGISVQVLSASGPRSVLSSASLTTYGTLGVGVAANTDSGGYMTVWNERLSPTKPLIVMQPIAANGVVDLAKRAQISFGPGGYAYQAGVCYAGAGEFMVAWGGTAVIDPPQDGLYGALVSAAGVITKPSEFLATDPSWTFVSSVEIAREPASGMMLVGFTHALYSDAGVFLVTPAVVRVPQGTLNADLPRNLAGTPGLPEYGDMACLDWSPVRQEFIVAFAVPGTRVAIRRLNADGTIRDGYGSFEGIGPTYVGTSANSVGIVRTFDGTDDGVAAALPATLRLLVQPLR